MVLVTEIGRGLLHLVDERVTVDWKLRTLDVLLIDHVVVLVVYLLLYVARVLQLLLNHLPVIADSARNTGLVEKLVRAIGDVCLLLQHIVALNPAGCELLGLGHTAHFICF